MQIALRPLCAVSCWHSCAPKQGAATLGVCGNRGLLLALMMVASMHVARSQVGLGLADAGCRVSVPRAVCCFACTLAVMAELLLPGSCVNFVLAHTELHTVCTTVGDILAVHGVCCDCAA